VSKRLFIQLAVFTLILFIVFMEPLCAQTYVVTETLDVSYDGTVHVKVEIVITEPVNILFPKGTSILDIIGTPKAIKEVEGKKLLIAFEPGEISVDYALPLLTATPSPTPTASPSASPSPTPSPTPTAAPTTMPVPYEYLLWAIIIGVVVIIAVAILKFRR